MDAIFNHVMTAVELFFAGVWSSVWHKGVLYAAILVLVGTAFGSQMLAGIPAVGPFLANFFQPLRKDLLWAAFGCALLLGGEYVGAIDARKECVARTVVIEKVVTKVVTKTKTPRARAAKDPWDNPEN
jgi:hypothetical protein